MNLKPDPKHISSQEFALTALSPLDGRYFVQTHELSAFFSEFSLIQCRIQVEVEYFLALVEIPLPPLQELLGRTSLSEDLRKLFRDFTLQDAIRIKEIEKITNHDVKAVEYFLKEKFEDLGLGKYKEFIHFGLTSQDVNNTAIPLLWKNSIEKTWAPAYSSLTNLLESLAEDWDQIPMMAYTHGQSASPTRLGKEIKVFLERLNGQRDLLNALPHSAKFGGATGNFNAHVVSYPKINWPEFANHFISNFGLRRSQYTTQIDNYDHLTAQLDTLKRINTILIDLCKDIWEYISKHYFGQKIISGEVGSSAMPHKVNPIDFENAEGNLGLANAIFEHLSAKLPISRLQRDLTDSTVLRNLGVPMGHTLIALKSILKGLKKLVLNSNRIYEDLENNWVVISEAIQTILRREGYVEPYEALKTLTRNHQTINQQIMHSFIEGLQISSTVKQELKQITPFNYFGVNS